MRVTYSELKRTFPDEKKSVESLYGRIFPARQISYFMTIPFLRFNISSFQVSVISMICAVTSCIFLCVPVNICRIVGIILVPVWHILDCVDGNIARYNKTASEYGEAVDAISGYYMYAFLPNALGIASYNISTNYFDLNPIIFLILGAVGSINDLLMRLIHQKYAYVGAILETKTGKHVEKGDNQYSLTGFHKIRKMIDVELGPVGIPMFVLWLAPVFNTYHILVIYYALFFSISLFVGSVYYLNKCHKVDK